MMIKNKNEKGAIMVEVLAVLALIGVMTPLIYRQIISRNQDISNVNMATEMRTIKDAMSAVIAADGAELAAICTSKPDDDGEVHLCDADGDFHNRVLSFLPMGMDEEVLDDYDTDLYYYSVDGGADIALFGIAKPSEDSSAVPSSWNLRRAARVSALIGANGGICYDGSKYAGSNGTWELSLDCVAEDVIATTLLDTFEPDLPDPNTVNIPDSLALKDLHAWNYFSVGQGEDKGCYTLHHKLDENGMVADDEIRGKGDSDCDPLFWVGADKGEGLEPGHVYVRNNAYFGLGKTGSAAVVIQNGASDADEEIDLAKRGIAVYDVDGNATMTINANGQIISNQKLSDVKADDGNTTSYTYGLDAAHTSVLNDIRLGARGGVRLSDILPDYVQKSDKVYSNGTKTSFDTLSIEKPKCPAGYDAAIVVSPLTMGKTKVPEQEVKDVSLNIASDNKTATGSITIPAQNTEMYRVVVKIDDKEKTDATDSDTTPWTVTANFDGYAGDLAENELRLHIQTYCVYDTTTAPDLAGDNLKETE